MRSSFISDTRLDLFQRCCVSWQVLCCGPSIDVDCHKISGSLNRPSLISPKEVGAFSFYRRLAFALVTPSNAPHSQPQSILCRALRIIFSHFWMKHEAEGRGTPKLFEEGGCCDLPNHDGSCSFQSVGLKPRLSFLQGVSCMFKSGETWCESSDRELS